ncbi:MAG: hypothetical protein HOP10_14975 [Chitinophagaceae bacterium]|nr:hypothetical protein [Chitinophagaceae bacterium]
MKKTFFLLTAVLFVVIQSQGQKIIPIEHNGKKYEVLDMTAKGKVMWGGYEEIIADAAKSESNGANNTTAIVTAVGNNSGFEGKPYAAKLCSEAKAGDKDDWYLPSKDESDAIYAFKEKFPGIEERGTIWTSTEASGTTAVSKYWYTGAYYNVQKVDTYQFVCIRKVE